MATRVTTYDPAAVAVSVAGNIITGFAPGRMMEYRPDAPVWQDALGVDNEVVRWATNNPMGTISLFLLQSSNSNFTLSTLLNLDRLTASQTAPFIIQDKSGTDTPTRMIATLGWVNTQAVLAWGAGPETRRWDLRLVLPIHDVHGLGEDNVISL